MYDLRPLDRLSRYAALHPHAQDFPKHLLNSAARQYQAFIARWMDDVDLANRIDKYLDEKLEGYRQRRITEHVIAAYLARNDLSMQPSPGSRRGMVNLVERLTACRKTGSYGVTEANELRIAWDTKCGLTRLCPDEAREEGRRIVERYVPPITSWLAGRRGRQVHYCVLTWPNIAAGQLAKFKRLMAHHVAQWLRSPTMQGVVVGALASQEDPLSARGDWNLHTNLELCVEGRFDWQAARRAWYAETRYLFPHATSDFSVHFYRVKDDNLVKSLMELVKYQVKLTAAPGDAKRRDAGQEVPPALPEWPPERFSEWWAAGLRFRRTRSYGCLYRLPAEPEPTPEKIVWYGNLRWSPDTGVYVVSGRFEVTRPIDLIQGDNFSAEQAEEGKNFKGIGGDTPADGKKSYLWRGSG